MMARFVSDKEAATYLGLEPSQFSHWVATGRLPAPLPDIDKWDLRALDVAADRLSGIGNSSNALDSWRERRRAS